MTWPGIAACMILFLIGVGSIMTLVEASLMGWLWKNRRFTPLPSSKVDCRGVSQGKWVKALSIADASLGKSGYPINAFAFSDYAKASDVVCENGSAIDSGIAIDYASKPDAEIADWQVKYVLESDNISTIDRNSDAAFAREERLREMTATAVALSSTQKRFSDMEITVPEISKKASKFFPDEEDIVAKSTVVANADTSACEKDIIEGTKDKKPSDANAS